MAHVLSVEEDRVAEDRHARGYSSTNYDGRQTCTDSDVTKNIRAPMQSQKVWKKKLGLLEALHLLQNLPTEISDDITEDFSDEEISANNLLEISLDS
ncbi:hypothetical protein TNCV_2890221 [Trichonephila clavipes]|nr:hypothetical protein TNCV_2890221 [Trichonephila clavipes]